MEKKAYQKEENCNILLEEKKDELKNNPINGSGSESALNSINSNLKEIEHSESKSFDPIPQSNNSFNISNENKSSNNNEENKSLNVSDNPKNNANDGELIDSDISEIKYKSIYASTNEINNIINILKDGNIKDNEKEIDNLLDSNISQDSNENQNVKNHNRNDSSIKNNSQNKYHKTNNGINSEKRNRLNKTNNLDVKEKINEGFIPFFIQIKGHKALFYYAKPDSQIIIPIEHYIKKKNIPNTKNCSFYYDNILIDINKTVGELEIKKFGLIKGEIL